MDLVTAALLLQLDSVSPAPVATVGNIQLRQSGPYFGVYFQVFLAPHVLDCHVSLMHAEGIIPPLDNRRIGRLRQAVTAALQMPLQFATSPPQPLFNGALVHRVILPFHVSSPINARLWGCRNMLWQWTRRGQVERRVNFHISIDDA